MRFDINRLSQLAGLGGGSSALNEAGNRSQHDEKALADEVPHRWGKGQLNEQEDDPDDDGPKDKEEGFELEEMVRDVEEAQWGSQPGDEAYRNEWGGRKGDKIGPDEERELAELGDVDWLGEEDHDMEEGDIGSDDWEGKKGVQAEEVMLEIDEGMLRNELRRMKAERLQENKLRTAIRNEIESIFGELGLAEDSSWVYGDSKPTRSRDGWSVVPGTAIGGIGFKNL